MRFKLIEIIAVLSLLSGCSMFRKTALKVASPLIYEAADALLEEDNWDNFEVGVVANLQLMTGLHSIVPEDRELLITLIKGYSGYAFAINETKYLSDKLSESEHTFHKDQAIANYTKSFNYALKYLALENITYRDLQKALKEKGGIKQYLQNQLSENHENFDAVFFAAYSLAGMINLQRDNMTVVAELPVAKGMFDWVCENEPGFNHGTCQIFFAGYEAGRPRMLGGNPAHGKKLFEEFIRKNPNNWLGRVAFIEYYAIPMSDEDVYEEQSRELNKAAKLHGQDIKWAPHKERHPAFVVKGMRFYQTLALKRFSIIKRYAKDIF